MRFTPRTWALLSLTLFVAAILFWLKGNEVAERQRLEAPAAGKQDRALDLMTPATAGVRLAALQVPGTPGLPDQFEPPRQAPEAEAVEDRHPFRLKNTSSTIDELVRNDRAILMANAFIETGAGDLDLPEHLRSANDPGSYIVQWESAPDARFRSVLAGMEARIISYVPNNAYLVRVPAGKAEELREVPGVLAVLAYEPYFKLDGRLLEAAVNRAALHQEQALRLTFFPGAREDGLAEVRRMHAQVLAEEPSPFGPQAIIRPPVHGLVDLAQLDSVQAIEPVFSRKPANDLTRIIVGVSQNSVTNANYLNLSGSNVWVNMNDTGVDTNHADLSGRVTVGHSSLQNDDPDGHGTFVAAIIAGDGGESGTVDEAPGSVTNANYRGLAPESRIFVLPLQTGEDVYPHVLDSYLYETAARTNYLTFNRTNSLISNNSWTYLGAAEYDSSAARYDAAVRDSIPGMTGEQPVLFIFAAGNGGFGNEQGTGGQPDGIFSPGTAKNVITVGALEHPRFIEIGYTNTNIVTFTNDPGGPNEEIITITNEEPVFPYFDLTDSGDEVASFSSRGNVGIGTEGFFGRFKPDLVAPGTMIISAKSAGFDLDDQLDTTNEPGKTFKALNDELGEYRIDSGTTYAAPVVSGLLALVQEFYQHHAPTALRRNYLSPALMKAIVINGARSLTANYDLSPRGFVNYQGWGLPNIERSVPTNLTIADEKKWSMRLVDQSTTNALASGQSRTWRITLSTNASAFPLRTTLVWTDPPGNPAVAVKLVNNLDLIVTNLDTGVVFYGNNIPGGSDFTQGFDPDEPGTPEPIFDFVNNVENVLILDPSDFGREFSITVRARRVNVDAVNNFFDQAPANLRTNDVVQDYALVISSDVNLEDQDVFEEFIEPERTVRADFAFPLTVITNGLPLLEQRVGANPSLSGTVLRSQSTPSTNIWSGITNQWNFYVFTNRFIENSLVSITNGSNVAFVIFNPPNLSVPRNLEADVDLYVSTNPQLTNLAPAVLASAFKSVAREGTEMVVFTNSLIDTVYYVAVKAEDQEGAEYSLMGLSSNLPFEEDQNGRRVLRGFPFSSFIPDGSPRQPGGTTVMAIGLSNNRVQRVVATNTISHENMGDLLGVLTHNNRNAVLNNHNLSGGVFFGTNTFVYDDFFIPEPGSVPTDGPGSLNVFAGQRIVGPWMLQMIDNAPGHTGRVELLTIVIDPLQENLLPGVVTHVTMTNEFVFFPVDVPPGVTNIIFEISDLSPAGAFLEAFFRRDLLPTFTEYDVKATNTPPADGFTFSYPTATSPPLVAGTYFLMFYNPNGATIDFDVLMRFEFGFDPNNESRNTLSEFDLLDDAMTNAVLDLTADKVVTSAEVGVRLDHPRMADLAMHLVSPQGTRVLLAENRGFTNQLGFGTTFTTTNGPATNQTILTNIGYTYFTEDTNLAPLPIKFAPTPYNTAAPTSGVFTNGFEGPMANNYVAPNTVAGWQVLGSGSVGDRVSIITGTNYAHTGTNLLSLGTGRVRRPVSLEVGKTYQLRFAYRTSEPLNFMSTGLDPNGDPLQAGAIDPHYQLLTSPHPTFDGPEAYVIDPLTATRVFSHWAPNTTNSQWIAPYPYFTNSAAGTYVYRTYLSLYGLNTQAAQVRFKWGADDFGSRIIMGLANQNIPASTPMAFNAPTNTGGTISGFQQGLNILTFEVDETNLVTGLRVEVLQDLPPRDLSRSSMALVFNGQTNILDSGPGWAVRTINFVPQTQNQFLEFRSNEGEVWIDSVEILGTSDSFVLPEETLSVLEGERAYGEWRLEVSDTRTGAIIPDPEMLTWKLNLTFAEPVVYGEHLRSGVTYPTRVFRTQRPGIIPGTLLTNHVHYFVVETCPDTTQARITLTGITNVGSLQLWADHTGFPTLDPERDDYVMLRNFENAQTGNGVAELLITTNSPAAAPLRPGKPLFVAVRNVARNQTNRYTLRATLDQASCQGVRISSAQLANNSSITSSLAASESAESEGELFEVEVPEGAMSLSFQVQADADAAFVVSQGAPPTRGAYDYAEDNQGSGSESLTITPQSPVPLTAGTWYILVLNNDSVPLMYTVTASFDEGAPVLNAALADGELLLQWNAIPGASYRIETSTDLENWSFLTTVTAEGEGASYSAQASGEALFYRVVMQE